MNKFRNAQCCNAIGIPTANAEYDYAHCKNYDLF